MTSKHFTPIRTLAVAAVLLLLPGLAAAVVNYEKGRITINNVVLLQDADDPSAYYYLPPYPTLARNKQGDFEFVCLKFVDPGGGYKRRAAALPGDLRAASRGCRGVAEEA